MVEPGLGDSTWPAGGQASVFISSGVLGKVVEEVVEPNLRAREARPMLGQATDSEECDLARDVVRP
jgi:hypothetical protein